MKNYAEMPQAEEEITEKHLRLHDAIMNNREIEKSLNRLISRIEGPMPETDENKAEVKQPPTLLDVLDAGPGEINRITQESINRIDRIIDLLYG